MKKLIFFLGGTLLGYAAPKFLKAAKDLWDKDIRVRSEKDVENEVKIAANDPDAVIIPIIEDDEPRKPLAEVPESPLDPGEPAPAEAS
ncbi:MAG: hypothetical protein LBF41_07570 [Deltaproteobacteria bacterium]|nr:hypothetical protein [Deltaproteobacteria bacterium]